MAQKRCEKCGDMVGEAKAFCPGCGHAFVEEEKRGKASNFESMDHTVQLGKTAYNIMLSDMGLNISEAPNMPPARPPETKKIEVLIPAEAPPAATPKPKSQQQPARPSRLKWIIAAGVVLVFLLLLAVIAGVLLYLYWPIFK